MRFDVLNAPDGLVNAMYTCHGGRWRLACDELLRCPHDGRARLIWIGGLLKRSPGLRQKDELALNRTKMSRESSDAVEEGGGLEGVTSVVEGVEIGNERTLWAFRGLTKCCSSTSRTALDLGSVQCDGSNASQA